MRVRILLAAAATLSTVTSTDSAAARTFAPPVSAAPVQSGSANRLAFPGTQIVIAGPDALVASGDGLLSGRPGALAPVVGPPAPMRASEAVLGTGGGSTVAVWRRDEPTLHSGIDASTRSAAGAWSTPVAVADAAAGGTRGPRLAVSSRGAAVLAFTQGTGGSRNSRLGQLAVSYRPPGGAFSTAQVFAPRGKEARVAIGADGQAAVAWRDGGAVKAVLVDRDGVGTPRTLGQGRDVAVAARADGAVVVAWTRYVARPRGRVQLVTGIVEGAFRPPGGRFGRPRRIATLDRTNFSHTRIVVAGRQAIVTWVGYDTPGARPRTRLWQRAVPGSAPPALLVDGVGRETDTDVVGLPDGRIGATWSTRGARGLPLRPWAALGTPGRPLRGVRLDGDGPPPPDPAVPGGATGDVFEPRMAAGPGTAVSIAWSTYEPALARRRLWFTQAG